LLLLLLVVLVRSRIVHRRFIVQLLLVVEVVVVRLMSVAVAVTPDDAAKATVRTFARVVVVDAVGPAARRAGTVLRRPLGQVHASAADGHGATATAARRRGR